MNYHIGKVKGSSSDPTEAAVIGSARPRGTHAERRSSETWVSPSAFTGAPAGTFSSLAYCTPTPGSTSEVVNGHEASSGNFV
eukprot:254699-Pyramimonas_sp.AAC.1